MSTYTILTIPGWEHLSLHPADAPALKDRLTRLAHDIVPDSLPRDRVTPFREELRKHLLKVVGQAQEAGASLISLPVQDLESGGVTASYSVAEVMDPNPTMAEPEALLNELLSRREDDGETGEATIVEIDHQPALREEDVVAPDPEADPWAAYPARRVVYTIAAPDMDGRFVIFTFTAIGDGDPEGELAKVLVEVFDAHMGTLRWKVD